MMVCENNYTKVFDGDGKGLVQCVPLNPNCYDYTGVKYDVAAKNLNKSYGYEFCGLVGMSGIAVNAEVVG